VEKGGGDDIYTYTWKVESSQNADAKMNLVDDKIHEPPPKTKHPTY
jgi:hypothetical protein